MPVFVVTVSGAARPVARVDLDGVDGASCFLDLAFEAAVFFFGGIMTALVFLSCKSVYDDVCVEQKDVVIKKVSCEKEVGNIG